MQPNALERFFDYGLGTHPIDWQVLGGLLAVVVVVWCYSAIRLVLRYQRDRREYNSVQRWTAKR